MGSQVEYYWLFFAEMADSFMRARGVEMTDGPGRESARE